MVVSKGMNVPITKGSVVMSSVQNEVASGLTNVVRLNETTYRLSFAVLSSDIYEQVSLRLTEMAKSCNLSGFRTLSSKKTAMEQLIGPQVRQEVIQNLLGKGLNEKLAELRLDIMGSPQYDWVQDSHADEDCILVSATFETYPAVSMEEYRSLSIEVPKIEMNYAEYLTELESLRNKFGKWVPAKKCSMGKHKFLLDMAFCINEKVLERWRRVEVIGDETGFVTTDANIQRLIDTVKSLFESAPVGSRVHVDITNEIIDVLPNQLANCNVIKIFICKILELQPEMDDRELLKCIGINHETGQDPWKEFTRDMDRRLEIMMMSVLLDEILEKILKHKIVEIPERFLDEQYELEIERSRKSLRRVEEDPVAAEISRLLIRGETKKQIVLDILGRCVTNLRGVGVANGSDRVDAVKCLLKWVGENAVFTALNLASGDIRTRYKKCSDPVRRIAELCSDELSIILRKGACQEH